MGSALRVPIARADIHETLRECQGAHVRRLIVTEPDASGCNWQAEWPLFRPANSEPCRSRLRHLVDELRLRYNVER